MQGRLEADLKLHAHKLQLMECNLLAMHKKAPKKLIIERLIIILGTADFATTLPSLVNGGNLFGMTKITCISHRHAIAKFKGSKFSM